MKDSKVFLEEEAERLSEAEVVDDSEETVSSRPRRTDENTNSQ